jgi:hypothetical protein
MARRRKQTPAILRVRGWAPGELILDGRKVDYRLAKAVGAGVTVKQSMLESSTLTIPIIDRDRALIRDVSLFGDKKLAAGIKVTTDGRQWELMEVQDTDQGYDLVCYPAQIAKLMRHHGKTMKWVRGTGSGQHSRYAFIAALGSLAGVEVVSFDGNAPQLVDSLSDDAQDQLDDAKASAVTADRDSASRLTKSGLTVQGAPMSAQQRRQAVIVLNVGKQVGANYRTMVAAFCAAIGESNILPVPNGAGSPYAGVFQALHTVIPMEDTKQQAYYFFKGDKGFQAGGAIAAEKNHPSWTVGEIALNVEGSQSNFASYQLGVQHYGQHKDEAIAIVKAFGKGFSDDDQEVVEDAGQRAYLDDYEFHRSASEDTWAAMRRTALDVEWRLFDWGYQVMYENDNRLANNPAELVLSEGRPGVESIRATWSQRKVIDEAEVVLRIGDWAIWPGAPVIIEGKPGANGRWIVREITKTLRADIPTATLALGRPEAPKPEPSADVVTVSLADGYTQEEADAADTTAGHGTGRVEIAASANRPGVKLQQPILDFLDAMTKYTDLTVTVTTGTNHNQYSTSGNVSDHWAGNAADLGVGGDARSNSTAGKKGDELAIAALRVLGVAPARARTLATTGQLNFSQNFSWKGHRVQVGWRTLVGGNHYNHVHVGVA